MTSPIFIERNSAREDGCKHAILRRTEIQALLWAHSISNAARLTEPWHTKVLFLATVARRQSPSTLPSPGLFTTPGYHPRLA